MFESDEGIETPQTDAAAESSPAQDAQPETLKAEASAEANATEKQVPFHEHPRFKELIEERKESARQMQEYKQQLAELSQRLEKPKTEKPVNPFVAKLKEIDPSYGEWAESMSKTAEEMAELREWRQQQEHQAIRTQYESTVDRLHTDNKVPENLRSFVKEAVDNAVRSNPKAGMQDVPALYKAAFEKYSSLIEGIKRGERASYVQGKSKDGAAPTSQPKGRPASPKQPSEFGNDREANMALIAKKAVKFAKAESDI